MPPSQVGNDVDRVLDLVGVGGGPVRRGSRRCRPAPSRWPPGRSRHGDAEALAVGGGDPRADQDAERHHEWKVRRLSGPSSMVGKVVRNGSEHAPMVAHGGRPCEPAPAGAQPSASGSTQPPVAAASVSAPEGPQVPRRYSLYRRLVLQHRVDDAPLLLDAVGAAEPAVVALHGVLEQPLIASAVREQRVVRQFEVDGPANQVAAGRLRPAAAGSRRRRGPGGTAAGWAGAAGRAGCWNSAWRGRRR